LLSFILTLNLGLALRITTTVHPKLVTFVIGLAITFVIGTAIGMLDHNQAFAVASEGGKASHQND
jgi:uncharacterized membrane protein